MLLFSWIFCLSLVLLVLAKEAPKDLVIETTHQPMDCTVKAKKGDKISVHYSGKLFSDNTEFDSSYKRGTPLPLTLGVGQVIRGWDQGLIGMCLNEKRTLTIPSDLAYGSRGAGGAIPPNAALVFDCELVSVERQGGHEEL